MRLRLAITAFFLLSGATALVYQVIWVRMLGLVVGNSVLAISTVVATYMAGLGLGARAVGRRSQRLERPLVAYGLLELTIGLFALASPLLLGGADWLAGSLDGLGAPRVATALVAGGLVLLLPTLAMGATLPLLTAWYARDDATRGRDMGWLYAINTTGAFLGAGAAGFLMLPVLGQPLSLTSAAVVNIGVGLSAALLGRSHHHAPRRLETGGATAAPGTDLSAAPVGQERAILLAFALSGAAAMINQVAWSRSFSLFTGSSTYAFSLIVCAFIAGLALGGHVASRRVDRLADHRKVLGVVNVGIAVSTLLLIPLLGELPLLLLEPLAARAHSFAATQGFLFALLFGLLLLPTLLMGFTYPVATRALSHSAGDAAEKVGLAYAWNTGGAILGALGTGLLLIPVLQLRGTLWLAVGVSLCAAAVLLGRSRRLAWALPALALVGALATPSWNPRHMNLAPHMYASDLVEDPAALAEFRDSGSVVFHEEGTGATVSVIQRSSGARVLRINGKTDASSEADRLTQGFLGALPLVLSQETSSICVIGLGSGMTLATALEFPLERALAIELLPEVVRGARDFGVLMGDPLEDSRVEVVVGDGRRQLLRDDTRYDVISSEPTNLFVSGVSTMFTRDTFAAMRERLQPGGVALVWLHGYLLREEDFRTVARTFQSVFPETHLWSASPFDLALTGHLEPLALEPEALDRRLAGLGSGRLARWTGIRRAEDLQRHYVMGPDALAELAGEGALHEDRDPFLEFTAPRALYDDAVLLDTPALTRERQTLPLFDRAGTPGPSLAQIQASAARIEVSALRGDLATLEVVLEEDPGHPFGRERLARLLHASALQSAQQGDFPEAERQVRRVLELEPQALTSWRLLSELRDVQGDPQGALAALEEPCALQPWNPYAQLFLAEYLAKLGLLTEADAALKAVDALDPRLPERPRP